MPFKSEKQRKWMHANKPEMAKKWEKEEESVDEEKKRDYKAEYKKFQSSTKAKKYRAELNKYNRKKGTYGNGDGKDASHKGGKIVGFESQSKNRGRAEKSRLKKEVKLNENPAAMAAAQAMTKIQIKNPDTGKQMKGTSALQSKNPQVKKKAKGIFQKLKDKFSKKKDDKPEPKKQSQADADFYKRQFTGEEKLREYIRQEIKNIKSVNEDIEDLKKIVGELEGASKMHLGQSKRITAHIKDMDVKEEVEMSKGVQKFKNIVDNSQAAKVGGTMVDMMSAKLFMTIYDKINDKNKEDLNKKSEKQMVTILHKMWNKFGKNVKF